MKALRLIKIVCVSFAAMLLAIAFFVQTANAAWEKQTNRPGMDFKNFWIDKDTESFVAIKQCEDACKKDTQCKAFTHVNPGVQGVNGRCYLKKGVPSPVKNINCTSGVVRPESKNDYCGNYAQKAVEYSKSNANFKCGYTGNRWSDNLNLHYDWCMKASDANTKYEENERKKLLDICMKPSISGDLSADDWCYDINAPGEITFYPIIKNAGSNHWKSGKEGYYKIGASVSTKIIEQKHTLSSFPHFDLQPYEKTKLEGLTLPYHPDNSYCVENIWTLYHPEDTRKDNNLNPGLKGYYKGAAFKTDAILLAKTCGNALLVITHEDFMQALTPLKNHKDATGIKTYIESWQSLTKKFGGIDLPERIKKGIADYKTKHYVRWVMLVGDSDRFPVRYLSRDVPLAQGYQASDLYYAGLYKSNSSFDNWDGNGNDIYAQMLVTSKENNIDEVNWHPDVAVARVPASTVQEVNNYVQKVIRYEMGAFNAPWFKKALFATGCDDCGDALGVSDYIAANFMNNFSIIKHYHTKTWQPYYPMQKPKQATQAFIDHMMDERALPMTNYINQGVGFINYYGHGSIDDFSWVYDSRHLNGLTNIDKLPVIFSRACETGKFASFPPLDNYYDSNGTFHVGHWPATNEMVPKPNPIQPHNCDIDARPEDWLVSRDTGAIAFIGSVGIANPGYADQMDKDFFKAYKLGNKTFGDLWVYMVQRYLDDYGYFDKQGNIIGGNDWEKKAIWNTLVRFNAFGDPSLRIGGISGI